jgi:phenylalanyl-tRNA synthetase alpha chain
MSEEEQAILTFLTKNELIEDSYPWASSHNLDHKKVVGAIKSLNVDDYVRGHDLSMSYYTLTELGNSVLENGSPEYAVFVAIQKAGRLNLSQLSEQVGGDTAKIGMANCMKSRWIKKDGSDLILNVESVTDVVQNQLRDLIAKEGNIDVLDDTVR